MYITWSIYNGFDLKVVIGLFEQKYNIADNCNLKVYYKEGSSIFSLF